MIIHLKEYLEKKIAIVWDNAAFHRSKAIRDQLSKGGIMGSGSGLISHNGLRIMVI